MTQKYVPTTLTTSTTPTTQAVRTIDKVASRVISDAEIIGTKLHMAFNCDERGETAEAEGLLQV